MQSAVGQMAVALGFAVALPTLAAEITFYEHDGLRGRSFAANQTVANFANIGFNDRASSVVVRSGTWQLCSDAYFRGRCVTVSRGACPTFGPGDYASLPWGLSHRISSGRRIHSQYPYSQSPTWQGPPPPLPPSPFNEPR